MPRILAAILAALLTACVGGPSSSSGSGSASGCVPGSTNLCHCSATQTGVQSCNDDGKGYTPCVCGSGGTANPGDASTITAKDGAANTSSDTATAPTDGDATAANPDASDTGTAIDQPVFTKDLTAETEDAIDWSELLDPEDTGAVDTGPSTADLPPKDASSDDCPERAKIVYVVTKGNQLLSFVPDKLQFKLVGNLKCPVAGGQTPFSMSVDRQANAWVLFVSLMGQGGPVMKVSTENAACQATNYQMGQQGQELFGMGFSSDAPAALTEKLFLAGTTSFNFSLQGSCTLATLDTKTMVVQTIAPLPKQLGCPDLSGNGNAELFGFFPQTNPAQVVKIDKATAQPIKSWPLPNGAFAGVEAWAFAQWGGKFWLFFKSNGDLSSSVWSLDPVTGNAAKVLANTGHIITGAGVSSCAPTEAVKGP
ncbi:MAG: hypothetical protein FJ100_03490 [Deltaproteobacteria bacterium]|nr:hypothetical protein [Deltaproteobacteria bacterium]